MREQAKAGSGQGIGNNNCDRAWENRSYVHILCFEKYEFELLNALFFSCGTTQSRQIYYINSVVILLAIIL